MHQLFTLSKRNPLDLTLHCSRSPRRPRKNHRSVWVCYPQHDKQAQWRNGLAHYACALHFLCLAPATASLDNNLPTASESPRLYVYMYTPFPKVSPSIFFFIFVLISSSLKGLNIVESAYTR